MIIQLSFSLWAKTKKRKVTHIHSSHSNCTTLNVVLYKVSLGGNQGISCQTSQRCLQTWNILHLSQKDSFWLLHLRTTSSKKEISCPHPKGLHTQWGRDHRATRHSGGSLHSIPGTLMTGTCASWSQSLHRASRFLNHTTPLQVASKRSGRLPTHYHTGC